MGYVELGGSRSSRSGVGETAWTGCVRAKPSLVASHSETRIPERFSFRKEKEGRRKRTKEKWNAYGTDFPASIRVSRLPFYFFFYFFFFRRRPG